MLSASKTSTFRMEAASNLGWHLAHYLQDRLEGYKVVANIYVLNTQKVARFKKGYDSLLKNDRMDAWVIADHLRFGQLPYVMKDSVQYKALQRLTRTCFHLIQNVTRDKTYFLNQVFLKFSGIRQDNLFSDTFGATCLAVIQELEPEQIVQMPMENLIEFLQEKGKNRFEKPEETAAFLQKLARSSFRLNKTLQEPVNMALSATLSVIQHMESEIKKLDKEIAKLMKAIPETLSSVKGIESVFAALYLRNWRYKAVFEPRCPRKVRRALLEPTFSPMNLKPTIQGVYVPATSIFTITWYKPRTQFANMMSNKKLFYYTKFDQVTKHQHERALVLTTRK